MAQTPTVSLLPRTVNLALYSGDGASVRLVVRGSDKQPLALTGAVTAQIRKNRTDLDATAVFDVDMTDAADGVIVISLTAEQTGDLTEYGMGKNFTGVWDAQWSPDGAEPVTLVQGIVQCTADVTRDPNANRPSP